MLAREWGKVLAKYESFAMGIMAKYDSLRMRLEVRLFASFVVTILYVIGLCLCWGISKPTYFGDKAAVMPDIWFIVVVCLLALLLNWHIWIRELFIDGKKARGVGGEDRAREIEQELSDKQSQLAFTIHEELGQQLVAIKMQIRQIEESLDRVKSQEVSQALDLLVETSGSVDEALSVVRKVYLDWTESEGERFQVDEAFARVSERFEHETGNECRFHLYGGRCLMVKQDPQAVVELYEEILKFMVGEDRGERLMVECMSVGSLVHMVISGNVAHVCESGGCSVRGLDLLFIQDRASAIGGDVLLDESSVSSKRMHFWFPMHR